jgi:hypothetical protein
MMNKERMDYVVNEIFVSCHYVCEGLHFACQDENSGRYEEDYDNRYAVKNDTEAYDKSDDGEAYWLEMVDDMVNELGITEKELEQGYEYINKL